jgi:hypothetical protein
VPDLAYFDPAADAEALDAQIGEIRALIDEHGEALHEVVPDVSAWSPAQQLYHTALAIEAMLKLALALSEGEKTRFDTALPLNAIGLRMLRRGLRKGGQAPPNSIPPAGFDAEELRGVVARAERVLDALRPRLATLREHEGRALHPYFGGLDAVEWVRSARMHTQHHMEIVRAALEAKA